MSRNRRSGHTGFVYSVVFSPDGGTLAAGDWEGAVLLWDVKTGEQKQAFTGHTDGVMSVAFSSDGSLLATGSWDRTVRLWDVKTGEQKPEFVARTDWVDSVAFSPDDRTLASSGQNGVQLWDVERVNSRRHSPGIPRM